MHRRAPWLSQYTREPERDVTSRYAEQRLSLLNIAIDKTRPLQTVPEKGAPVCSLSSNVDMVLLSTVTRSHLTGTIHWDCIHKKTCTSILYTIMGRDNGNCFKKQN